MTKARRLIILSLALLAASCGRATASRQADSQNANAPTSTAVVTSSPAATPTETNTPTTPPATTPAPEVKAPAPAAPSTLAPERQAAKEMLAETLQRRDVDAVAVLNQTWNATLESNPLAKGWVRITLVSQGKVKIEGEMPDNEINDGFMASVVGVFGVENIENNIKKFPQPTPAAPPRPDDLTNAKGQRRQ